MRIIGHCMRSVRNNINAVAEEAKARPSEMGRKTAAKAALALVAIALSAWVVLRTFVGDEPAIVHAQAEEQARQQTLREEFPPDAVTPAVAPAGRVPN